MRLAVTCSLMLVFCLCAGNTSALDVDIYSTRLGDKILELDETRQLTTKTDGRITHVWMSPSGKHVAYIGTIDAPLDEHLRRLCIVSATGGRSVVLVDEWQYLPLVESFARTDEFPLKPGDDLLFLGEGPDSDPAVVWAPDGRSLAFSAMRMNVTSVNAEDSDDIDGLESQWILVVNTSGARIASFPISTVDSNRDHEKEGLDLQDSLHWSRDSRRLAAAYDSSEDTGILVMDVTTGSTHRVVAPEEHRVWDLVGWSAVGGDLLYVGYGERVELRQISVDGSRNISLGDWDDDSPDTSPDGRFKRTRLRRSTQEIENLSTGEKMPIPGEFVDWSPNSRLFSFTRAQAIDVGENGRRFLNMLWVQPLDDLKSRPICVAADFDDSLDPAWSADSMTLAYVQRGRLHTATLLLREASSMREKNELGVPLSEAEQLAERNMLLGNAKQIGAGLQIYASDWDGQWPSADTFAQDILPYVFGNEGLFCHPGTDEMIFRYYPPPSGVYNSSETVVGIFDTGYGWRILLYADGRAEMEERS